MTVQMLNAEQLFAWVERARPGEDAVYATGERPPADIAAVARGLYDARLVTLTSLRVKGGHRFILQRLPDVRPSQLRLQAQQNRGKFVKSATDGRVTAKAVLRLLSHAASHDLPCPTNAELARRVGLKDAIAASYRVRRLVADGKITVELPSPIERRVVTIIATGKSTRRMEQ
jgi:hypothetical protein